MVNQSTTYPRVLPRDLFNEALLLKSVGRLILLMVDGVLPRDVWYLYDEMPFEVVQNEDDGTLRIGNITVYMDETVIDLYTEYNSRDNYPLLAVFPGSAPVRVFNMDGSLTSDFYLRLR